MPSRPKGAYLAKTFLQITAYLLAVLLGGIGTHANAQISSEYDIYSELTEKLFHLSETEAADYYPLHIVLMFDVSRSMEGDKRDKAFGAWRNLIQYFLRPGDKLTFVPFAETVKIEDKKTLDYPANGDISQLNSLIATVGKAPTRKGTILYEAQRQLLNIANQNRAAKEVVLAILVTDISDTDPDTPEDRRREDLAKPQIAPLLAAFQSGAAKPLSNLGLLPFLLKEGVQGKTGDRLYVHYAVEGGFGAKRVSQRILRRKLISDETPSERIKRNKKQQEIENAYRAFASIVFFGAVIAFYLAGHFYFTRTYDIDIEIEGLYGPAEHQAQKRETITAVAYQGSAPQKNSQEILIKCAGSSETPKPIFTLSPGKHWRVVRESQEDVTLTDADGIEQTGSFAVLKEKTDFFSFTLLHGNPAYRVDLTKKRTPVAATISALFIGFLLLSGTAGIQVSAQNQRAKWMQRPQIHTKLLGGDTSSPQETR